LKSNEIKKMSSKNIENMNDHIEISKPVRHSYIDNGHHKKHERKQYILLDQYKAIKTTIKDG